MTTTTEQTIIKLNKDFYDNISKYWNSDPNYYWTGWYKLLPYLQEKINTGAPIKILDLGCGNGRFLSFLHANFPNNKSIFYTGVDNSDYAKIDTSLYSSIKFNFLERDLLKEDWDIGESYDIVAAFGIIHHIPGERLLLQFFNNLQKVLAIDGLGVITTWQYMRLERLKKRLIKDQDKKILLEKLSIEKNELRQGDNFLDWIKGDYGIRFSHFFEEAEVLEVLEKFSLKIVEVYLDDDKNQNRNQYFVFT
jgi:tRNA (uracil-5-)-methyltransferase TRM9